MLIKNAKVVQSKNQTQILDIWIQDGKIQDLGQLDIHDDQVIDAKEHLVIPGGVEVHAHFREPGFEEKETIETGTMAAAKGGYTSVMPMPNLNPHPDNVDTIADYLKIIDQTARVNVYPYACITEKSQGETLVDMKAIKDQFGFSWFTDDGVGVQDPDMMRQAMKAAKANDAMIVAHTEDMTYRPDPESSVHDGQQARLKGWVGIPSETESKQIERDLQLAKETGAAYHICHMSAIPSIEALRQAKADGVDASGEVTIHHLLLNEFDVTDTNFKMNPPLRTKEDQEALREALLDGTIDFLASDHAPHTQEDKDKEMGQAAFGIVSIESALPLFYTHFVETGLIDLERFIQLTSTKPAERFGLKNKGRIAKGYDGDLVILSEDKDIINKNDFLSKGRNTPFDGWECSGFPQTTIVGGQIVWQAANS